MSGMFGYGGGGGGNASPLISKGDIYGFSTENARLPIDVIDGKVLMTDSSQALGIKWGPIPAPQKGTGDKLYLYNNAWGGF